MEVVYMCLTAIGVFVLGFVFVDQIGRSFAEAKRKGNRRFSRKRKPCHSRRAK